MSTPNPALPVAPIARRAVEDALLAWIEAGTGLGSGRVFWQGPGIAPPSFPFATLSWLSTVNEGHDALVIEDIAADDAPTPDIRYHAAGLRLVTISVQVFADVSEGGPMPEAHPGMRLDSAVAKLILPTTRGALIAAGFYNARSTTARRIDDGQWSIEVTGYVVSDVSEDIYSIQYVVFEPTDDIEGIGSFEAPPIPPQWTMSLDPPELFSVVTFDFEDVNYTATAILGPDATVGTVTVESIGTGEPFVVLVGSGGAGGDEATGRGGGGGGCGASVVGVPPSELGAISMVANQSANFIGVSWFANANKGGNGGVGNANGAVGGNASSSGMVSSTSRGGSGGGGGGSATGGAGGTGDVVGHAGRDGGTGGGSSGGGGGGTHGVGGVGTVDGGAGGHGGALHALAQAAITALLDASFTDFAGGGGGGASVVGAGGAPGTGSDGIGADELTAGGAGVKIGGGGGGAWAGFSGDVGGAAGPPIAIFIHPT